MANVPISGLPAAASLDGDELLEIVNDPAGTPVSERTTAQDIADLHTGVAIDADGAEVLPKVSRVNFGTGLTAVADGLSASVDVKSKSGGSSIEDPNTSITIAVDFSGHRPPPGEIQIVPTSLSNVSKWAVTSQDENGFTVEVDVSPGVGTPFNFGWSFLQGEFVPPPPEAEYLGLHSPGSTILMPAELEVGDLYVLSVAWRGSPSSRSVPGFTQIGHLNTGTYGSTWLGYRFVTKDSTENAGFADTAGGTGLIRRGLQFRNGRPHVYNVSGAFTENKTGLSTSFAARDFENYPLATGPSYEVMISGKYNDSAGDTFTPSKFTNLWNLVGSYNRQRAYISSTDAGQLTGASTSSGSGPYWMRFVIESNV